MRIILILVSIFSLSQNCFAKIIDYDEIKVGKLSGKLTVQWIEPDLFIFIPDAADPLKFQRNSNEVITPGRMITDGGSIPRPIWVLRNYSPWGFAPAFIVHDWLFAMKKCQMPGFDRWSLEEAGLVMAEIMKSMIELKKIDASRYTVIAMHEAVTSRAARATWNDGACAPVPPAMDQVEPIVEYELNFSE